VTSALPGLVAVFPHQAPVSFHRAHTPRHSSQLAGIWIAPSPSPVSASRCSVPRRWPVCSMTRPRKDVKFQHRSASTTRARRPSTSLSEGASEPGSPMVNGATASSVR
jgi:hypothetical protein